MMNFDEKLEELYIDLPEPISLPTGITAVYQHGKIISVVQALPFAEGKLITKGRVGVEVRVESARLGARAALLYTLGVLVSELGTLKKIKRILHMDGFVVSGADFQEHEKVFEGASDLLRQIFGKCGEHSRNLIGVTSLPRGAAVSLSLSVEIR